MSDFDAFYRGRRVLVTGDTGFKGSWLCLWLDSLGADVVGFAMPPPPGPSNFAACRIGRRIQHVDGDVRDLECLSRAVACHGAEVVFHLAAQPLVQVSHEYPVETFSVNVLGTVHLLEAVRRSPSVRSVVVVTSDKCYHNRGWVWGYRETDELGGDDPYSASKACAELVVTAYRRCFEELWKLDSVPAVASARAGNVIGGGDWSQARLVPDIVRSVQTGCPLTVRMPAATRPWQHVLEAISGYLWLGRLLATGDPIYRSAWNFATMGGQPVTVGELSTLLLRRWSEQLSWVADAEGGLNGGAEAVLLRLDSDKARRLLGWRSVWALDEMIDATAEWYAAHLRDPDADMAELCLGQIERYTRLARQQQVGWANDRV
jgi:CDP-glucose 4,6-dehydratase